MLSLDGWTLFFTVLNVIVLFVGLRLLLFKPVLKIISQREEMIKTQLKEAAAKEQQAEQLKNDYQEKLKDAGHKAEEIIAQAKSRAAREQSEAAVKAKEEAEKMLEKTAPVDYTIKARFFDKNTGAVPREERTVRLLCTRS